MTPNREEIRKFPFASSANPAQWTESSLKHSGMTSANTLPKVTVANCLPNPTLIKENQSGNKERNEESNVRAVDSSSRTSVGLINAQQYLSQIYFLRQQAIAAANRETNEQTEMDSQDDERSLPTPTNFSDSNSDKVKNLLQTFATSAGNNNNLLFSYGYRLPWPAASLTAIAANQQLSAAAATSCPETNMYAMQSNKYSGKIDSLLGNLLPPPPSLPTRASSPNSALCERRTACSPVLITTTSHSKMNLSLSRPSGLNIHTSVAIPQQAIVTSSKERSLPLDLSVTRRERLEETAARSTNQNGDVADASGQKLSSSTYSRTVLAANMTNNNNLLPQFAPSYKLKGETPSPTYTDSVSQRQHFALSSPRIQSNQLISVPLIPGDYKRNLESLTDFQRDSLQKWIYASQQNQQAFGAQQVKNQQGKRPNSVC